MLLVSMIGPAHATGAVACDAAPDTVVTALFGDGVAVCDPNADGVLSAADLTAAVLVPATPQPTATATPTATTTPSATSTPTMTATPTERTCPAAGADLVVEIDNQTGNASVEVGLSGQRLGDDCVAGALPTSYSVSVTCAGTGVVACATVTGLAPGPWNHTISVATPATRQAQNQTSLVIAGSVPNRVRFTAFASVAMVTTTANDGNGSLRKILLDADSAAKPLLVQFDPTAFPAGTPTPIALKFKLPDLAASDVTIDGTDETGAIGNRIIDAGGLAIPALSITGARNHIIGLHLRNAGDNNRDVLSITGPQANANLVEHCIIEGAATGDGVGVDQQAGKDFGDTVNVIRECAISGASDKGVKVTTGAHARIERSWVHDNQNGGIQSTLGGHVQAWRNLIEANRGGTAQNGLSVNTSDEDPLATDFSELMSWANISRRNGANGLSVRALSFGESRQDYFAANGTSGIRVFNDVGGPATAVVEGTSAVCNATDGATVAITSQADFGGGPLGSAGNNAFTQNNLPTYANLRNGTAKPVSAINNQWEHCGPGTTCDDDTIKTYDLSDHGASTPIAPSQAHRSQQPPVLTQALPSKGKAGDLLRIFGSGFNVIDGHFSQDKCADVAGRNRCLPVRGNCVQINGVPAQVEAVTPTMLVVHWPFTCIEPVPLVVKIDQGPTVTTSLPLAVCTDDIVP